MQTANVRVSINARLFRNDFELRPISLIATARFEMFSSLKDFMNSLFPIICFPLVGHVSSAMHSSFLYILLALLACVPKLLAAGPRTATLNHIENFGPNPTGVR